MERVALIDLGSNTARLVIYDVLDGGYFVVAEEQHEAVRLGETEADGSLKQTRMMQAISTLKMFKEICLIKKVDKVLAVATAAVRRASNQKTFLSDVYNETGIRITVVSEEEEANYVYQGVINSMDIPRGLIMEIGGGSTKLVYYNRRTILHTKIFAFGAVTLTNMFVSADKTPEQCSDDIVSYVKSQLDEVEWFKEIDPDTQLIGVGGSCRNLARIVCKVKKYPLDMVHNLNMQVEDFNYIYNMIRTLDLDKKRRIKGLSSARADVFPAALAFIKAFVDHMGFTKIISSGSGLREGVMFNYAVPQTLEKPISDVLGHSLHAMALHMGVNIAHAEQTFNLCVQLFKQLRVLHKFPRCLRQSAESCRNVARYRQNFQVLQQRQAHGIHDSQQQSLRYFPQRSGACLLRFRRKQQGRGKRYRLGKIQRNSFRRRRGSPSKNFPSFCVWLWLWTSACATSFRKSVAMCWGTASS